jgi:soluble lytic murein transglycosylase
MAGWTAVRIFEPASVEKKELERTIRNPLQSSMRRRWLWLLLGLLLFDGILAAWWSRRHRESRFDTLIVKASKRYGVDAALVKAVIWRESNFNPSVVGTVGEIGLMQLRSMAASEWAQAEGRGALLQERLYDPETNIQVGTWYLGKLLKRYQHADNAVPYALADYNAGRTHVLRWMQGKGKTQSAEFLSQMDFRGTQQYIQAIMKRHAKYQPSFASAK